MKRLCLCVCVFVCVRVFFWGGGGRGEEREGEREGRRERKREREGREGREGRERQKRKRDLKLTFNLKLLLFKLRLVDETIMLALSLIVFLCLRQLLLCQPAIRLPSLLHACA